MALLMVSVIGNAFGLSYWQDNRTRQRAAQNRNASAASRKQTAATTKKAATAAGKPGIMAQPILADDDTIIIGGDLMDGLDQDLNAFLNKILDEGEDEMKNVKV